MKNQEAHKFLQNFQKHAVGMLYQKGNNVLNMTYMRHISRSIIGHAFS